MKKLLLAGLLAGLFCVSAAQAIPIYHVYATDDPEAPVLTAPPQQLSNAAGQSLFSVHDDDIWNDAPDSAWLNDNGTLIDLKAHAQGMTVQLGSSYANHINEAGRVVGHVDVFMWRPYAFVWEAGTMYTLEDTVENLGAWQLEEASAIDDSGTVFGWGRLGPTGDTMSFVATLVEAPLMRGGAVVSVVPEPETWALFVAGMLMVARRWRRVRA